LFFLPRAVYPDNPLLPYLLAGPRFFAGTLTLGEFVQINGAFGRVEGSLGWLMTTYPAFAEWRATPDRLSNSSAF
jgi:vitamin B12/bleomycin/antimicrobial peptide transport system ATP-binding/permease protein